MTASLLVPEALQLTMGGDMEIVSPHSILALLQARGYIWIQSGRLFKIQELLLENSQGLVTKSDCWNPATHLPPNPDKDEDAIFHNCLDMVYIQTKTRADLKDSPLENPTYDWSWDVSSFVDNGI